MPENTSSSIQVSLPSEISSIALSRNPLAILFGIARIRELVEDFAGNLLSSIEYSYYLESSDKFISLIELYARNDFFRIVAAAEQGTGDFEIHKKLLDRYFGESYYRDVDFYFFVLDKYPIIHAQFEGLIILLNRIESGEKVTFDSIDIADILKNTGYTGEDISKTPAVQNFFKVLIPEICNLYSGKNLSKQGAWKLSGRRLVRDLYLHTIANGNVEHINFWRTYFIDNSDLNSAMIETLDHATILECFRFLRGKLLKIPKYNLALSDKSVYRILMKRADAIADKGVLEKIDFIADLNKQMGNEVIRRENFVNVLRKGLVFEGDKSLVDGILGVGFLKRAAFFEVKKRMVGVDFSKYLFPSLSGVLPLVAMLENSIVLRFFRPFFIYRLARVFNIGQTDLYYFIKFILTIHNSRTYSEYLQISRFFLSLESFGRQDMYGIVMQTVQFGWIIVALCLLIAIAPFGVFLAITLFGIFRIILMLLKKHAPSVVLVSNFGIGMYLALFAAVSFSFGMTFGLKDNTAIVYSNYRLFINSSTLITSEVISKFSESVGLKASVNEIPKVQSGGLERIRGVNYLEGKSYSNK